MSRISDTIELLSFLCESLEDENNNLEIQLAAWTNEWNPRLQQRITDLEECLSVLLVNVNQFDIGLEFYDYCHDLLESNR